MGLYIISIPETHRNVDLTSNLKTDDARIAIYWRSATGVIPQQRWVFESTAFPSTANNIGKPLVSIPILRPGVYRIRSAEAGTLATLSDVVNDGQDGPKLVGKPDATDKDGALYQ